MLPATLIQLISYILVALSVPKFTWSSSFSNSGDLIINVGYSSSNEDPPTAIYRQVISGNSSTDTVVIEFTEPDGTLITQLTDFRKQSQIMRVIISGEEELGQPLFQVLCFVSYFKEDLISPEAVMKLRQKHPGALRTAEEDQGDLEQDSPLSIKLNLPKLTSISSHLSQLCKDAKTTSYTSQEDLQNILNKASNQGNDRLGAIVKPSIGSLTTSIEGYEELPSCSNLSSNINTEDGNNNIDDEQDEDIEFIKDRQCKCKRKVWLNWYPCDLKYCQNKDGVEKRCGIKTCKKSITYQWPTAFRFCTILNNDEMLFQ